MQGRRTLRKVEIEYRWRLNIPHVGLREIERPRERGGNNTDKTAVDIAIQPTSDCGSIAGGPKFTPKLGPS